MSILIDNLDSPPRKPKLAPHSAWLFPSWGRFAITEAIRKCVANSEGNSKAGAPKLFSVVTASLELVHSLPRAGFWRGEILIWMYKYWHIYFNIWIKNWKHQQVLRPSEYTAAGMIVQILMQGPDHSIRYTHTLNANMLILKWFL